MTESQEGVIKYELTFIEAPIEVTADTDALNAWRTILWKLALVGADPSRYDGYGFGNVSHRTDGTGFLISGTQTGAIDTLNAAQYAWVKKIDFMHNRVYAQGQVKPSSESLTHALILDLCPSANAVLHVHSPDIWQRASQLGIPETADGVDYGTLEMVNEVKRLFATKSLDSSGVFSMRGHEDGIVAYGDTAEQAGIILLSLLARCLTLQ